LLAGCASFGGAGGGSYLRKSGVYVENSSVRTWCLSPKLRVVISRAERHFNRPVVLTSGYRNPVRNWRNGGASDSYHMKCLAADVFVPGDSKATLIAYMRNEDAVGGLGCYPGRKFIHIDVRDRPRGQRGPITFNGC
jgi:uncharacterized protein YcbK (DUF882 family)